MIDEKTPTETWDQLKNNENTVLIDVRTPQEWQQIGYPDLSSLNKNILKISVQNIYGERNNNFISDLTEAGLKPEQTLYFVCRSGKRSMLAAMLAQQAGFSHVINVQDGFEGPADQTGRTGNIAGWLAEKLPAIQPI
ncbi:rhodanese-like domain-containing protein [Commensalibacter communis]|uniref:rhodanese-like domain-containing protein n=1 Tax=Commensalibacter communis TaxID=2972786 RepID=UPI0022FF9184|nr:rhodanese-like domain-containing protein [Commensalibacter communis]CAI3922644.1 Rhodanese-related sulfurtransferase (PspE) (PDB:1TQ1) [Commensalibacter communis]CAI3932165.1 Rhodanese-related sulfurtransferase (PspE) (PDB:1TQ1) [Commensalibacter communis]